MSGASPTVPKRRLGMALRRRRQELGLEREEPARLLACSPSKIGRIEAGDVGVKHSELRDLLDLYQVAGHERAELERMGVESRHRRRRTSYGTALPDWFRKYLNLEEGATGVKSYSTELIPGLFQTEAYARALTMANPLPAPGDADRLVQARMARQERLGGDDPLRVWAVLSEGALRNQAGGARIQREQLSRLRAIADLPNVTVQVSRFQDPAHAAAGFAFSMLELPNTELDVVYLEDLTSARYVDNDATEQQRYALVWSHLVTSASSPEASAAFIDTLIGETT